MPSFFQTIILILLSALISPVQAQVKLIYTFDYAFLQDTVKNAPSRTDLNTLICLTDKYLTEVYKEYSGNDAMVFQSTNIGWVFDRTELNQPNGLPLEMTMAADVTTTDGSEMPSLAAMAQYSFDFYAFIGDYLYTSNSFVWKNLGGMAYSFKIDVPKKGKLERSVCDGTFQESNAGGVTRPPRGQGGFGETPAPTPPATAPPVQVVLAAIEFKFLDGSAREPTAEELDDVMCLTDDFFSARMQTETGDPSTDVKGRVLQYFLNPDQTVWVMIAQNVTAQRTTIEPSFIQKAINEFSRTDVVRYIQNYAWKAMSGSLFKDTTSVSFSATINNDPMLLGLESTCRSNEVGVPSPPTQAPSIAAQTSIPTSTPATETPTSPPSLGPRETQVPTTSPTPADTTQEPTISTVADTTQEPTVATNTEGTHFSFALGIAS